MTTTTARFLFIAVKATQLVQHTTPPQTIIDDATQQLPSPAVEDEIAICIIYTVMPEGADTEEGFGTAYMTISKTTFTHRLLQEIAEKFSNVPIHEMELFFEEKAISPYERLVTTGIENGATLYARRVLLV
jgi:hypothetical protein